MMENAKFVEIEGKKLEVKSPKFKDVIKVIDLIGEIVEDFSQDRLRLGIYLERAVPLMSAMTGLTQMQIEELKPADGLRLLSACIEVILEDVDFLEQIKELLRTASERIASLFTK